MGRMGVSRVGDAETSTRDARHPSVALGDGVGDGNIAGLQIQLGFWLPKYARADHRVLPPIAEGTRALELDPLSLMINADLGQNYLMARRYVI